MLFRSKPTGENHQRNLAKQHPEIVARLDKRLLAWAAELQPKGLSTDNSGFSRHHEEMFAEHDIIAGKSKGSKPATTDGADASQGWITRDGTLEVKDGVMKLSTAPDLPKNMRLFLTHSSLDLAGPVTATLRLRAKTGGDRKSTRLNSSHVSESRMPSSA